MNHAEDSTVLGNFDGSNFTNGGVTSTFFKNNNDFFVYTEGINGNYDTFKIEYTFGITPLQQYLVKTNNGKLQALRTAWDVKNKKWYDLYPDQEVIPQDWLHWTRGGMNWNTMCAECHSTNLEKNYNARDDSYQTTYSVINVSCESCHGPGEGHVQSIKSGKEPKDFRAMLLDSSTNYNDQIRSCAPCHSRKSNLTENLTFSGEFMNDYILSILSDELYHGDGQINEEVYVYGSFLQSKMYANGVKCTDCHDAHSLTLKKEGNDLCLQCHDAGFAKESHTHHAEGSEGNQCIECHMTGKTYMGTDFRRDHSFRIPRPDQSVSYGTPNACTSCHEEKEAKWAAEKINTWYGKNRKFHFSDVLLPGRDRSFNQLRDLIGLLYDTAQPDIARATAAYYLTDIPAMESVDALSNAMHDPSPLVRYYAVSGFMNFPENEKSRVLRVIGDSIKSVRTSAANVLLNYKAEQIPEEFREKFILASAELEKSLYNQLDFPMGQFQMAQYYYRKGDEEKALIHFQRSIEMDTLLHISRENMARIHNQLGQNEKAKNILKTTLSLDNTHSQAYYSLALIYAEESNLEKAAELLLLCIKYDPYNERAYYNLGLAYQHGNKPEEAEAAYTKGIEALPGTYSIRNALAILYIQTGNKKKADIIVKEMERAFPESEEVKELRKALR